MMPLPLKKLIWLAWRLRKKCESLIGFRAITVEQMLERPELWLYAGDLPNRRLYGKFVGLSLTQRNRQHFQHDVTQPLPLPDNCADGFQSEDVFEHIDYEKLPAIIDEIYRVLKPGKIFRLGVPDYRCDILEKRSKKNAAGEIIWDPRGGGRFENGRVTHAGHVWFPKLENVRDLLARTKFRTGNFLHYYDEQGRAVMHPIDYSLGHLQRTPDHDERVKNPRRPMSLVVDCVKPAA